MWFENPKTRTQYQVLHGMTSGKWPHTACKSSGAALSHFTLTNWKPTIPYTIQKSGTVFTVCKSINVGYLAPLSKYAVCRRDHESRRIWSSGVRFKIAGYNRGNKTATQLVFYSVRLKMMYQCKVMNLCFPPFQVFGSHFCYYYLQSRDGEIGMPQPITAALLLLTHEKHHEKLWLHIQLLLITCRKEIWYE